ncbi:MAG: hypothetical protein AAF497_14155 [Planctomycetota bacterium]
MLLHLHLTISVVSGNPQSRFWSVLPGEFLIENITLLCQFAMFPPRLCPGFSGIIWIRIPLNEEWEIE